MPAIPNFPPELLAEHRNWHHARHQVNTNNPPPGYGLDFLQFHRQYIAKARQWYLQQGYDPGLIQPWGLPPEQIRRSPCYDVAAEQRITMNPRSFASADELGRFIEASGLHNCIHQQAALYYNEPALNDLDIAPGSTVFYQIHGMIDRWYAEWLAASGMSGAPATRLREQRADTQPSAPQSSRRPAASRPPGRGKRKASPSRSQTKRGPLVHGLLGANKKSSKKPLGSKGRRRVPQKGRH
ncbi:hypothetical protein [Paenibacillus daejeonensis]|uniref:hypothetical protein n=1 Tax=Paenibacillus daejeonensis TaxID=135193 RepID=UPI00036BB87D|nr:hypothetical protein [Paenibacillus daejeonensis]